MEKRPHYYRKKKKKKKQQVPRNRISILTGTALSCGELAINGKQILRLYVTSGVYTSRNKCTKILKK